MDEEGSTGSQEDAVKLEEESKLIEEAIEKGMKRASVTSIQSCEDTVFQFTPVDRGRFQVSDQRRQAIKEQLIRLKSRKMDKDFYRWNKDFPDLCDFWGIKPYLGGDKQFPSTQEILCDTLADEDEEKYVNEVIPWICKDVFARVFLTLPDSKSMEILHLTEIFQLEISCSHVKYYLPGQLDTNKMMENIVTKRENIFSIHDQICQHYLKLTGTSMMTSWWHMRSIISVASSWSSSPYFLGSGDIRWAGAFGVNVLLRDVPPRLGLYFVEFV